MYSVPKTASDPGYHLQGQVLGGFKPPVSPQFMHRPLAISMLAWFHIKGIIEPSFWVYFFICKSPYALLFGVGSEY